MLQTLSDSFTQFRMNYNVNKHLYSMTELLKELQSAEGLIKPVAHVYATEKGSAPKSKSKKKQKKGQKPQAQGVVKKPRTKCFQSKQSRHWKK